MRILLVEDNLDYRVAATRALEETLGKNISLHTASSFENYTSVPHEIDGALVDCFFPDRLGSGRTDLGMKVIEKITDRALHERLERDLVELSEIADMSIPAVNDYFRGMLIGAYSRGLDVKRLLPLETMKHASRTLGSGIATHIAQQEPLLSKYKQDARRDYFKAMSEYLAQSESNQPLGIAVAESLEERRVPFVLCTSTFHHDNVTQPIQNYSGKHGWTLIDCPQNRPEHKSTREYWQNAFDTLKSKIEGGKR